MWFFPKRKKIPPRDGLSEKTAFRFPAIGSPAAISIEFETLAKMFGKQDADWRVHDRLRSVTSEGRQIEKFVVETREGRRVVHFDITDVLSSDASQQAAGTLTGIMESLSNRRVLICLPESAFLMLYKIVEEVGAEIPRPYFDLKSVSEQLLSSAHGNGLDTQELFEVELTIPEWVHILSLTRMITPPSLSVEELTNDLRAYIEGALKRAGYELHKGVP